MGVSLEAWKDVVRSMEEQELEQIRYDIFVAYTRTRSNCYTYFAVAWTVECQGVPYRWKVGYHSSDDGDVEKQISCYNGVSHRLEAVWPVEAWLWLERYLLGGEYV